MQISTSSSNDNLIIAITGRMDAQFIQEKREELELLPKELNNDILFDLSGTDFIDSSGIGFLVYIFKRLKPQQRQLAIMGLNGQPQEVFKMLHIDRMIDCVSTVEEFELKISGKTAGSGTSTLRKLVSPKRFFKTTSQTVTRP